MIKKSNRNRYVNDDDDDQMSDSENDKKLPAKPIQKKPSSKHHTPNKDDDLKKSSVTDETGPRKNPRNKKKSLVLDLGVAEEARTVIPLTPEEAEKMRTKYPPVGVVPIKDNRLKVLRSDVPKEINSSVLKKWEKWIHLITRKK